jgi:hypothetical protein
MKKLVPSRFEAIDDGAHVTGSTKRLGHDFSMFDLVIDEEDLGSEPTVRF